MVQDAIDSAHNQTVPVEVVTIEDKYSRGAGWARNQGMLQVKTPFVIFLDADDKLMPTFVERTASAYRRGVFVYTDWYDHSNTHVQLPDCSEHPGWIKGETLQLVTTLLPTVFVKAVRGFDETLPTAEDTDLYHKLRAFGTCGIRVPEPLVEYRRSHGRRALRNDDKYDKIRAYFRRRYPGARNMACCGDNAPQTALNGDYQEGDVKVVLAWAGNRSFNGPVSNRRYRGGNNKLIWMARADADLGGARGMQWTIQQDPYEVAPDTDLINKLVGIS